MEALFALLVILSIVIVWVGKRYRVKVRRSRLLQTSLDVEDISIVKRHVPLYSRLPKELQITLQGCINYFLDEKVFVGCENLEVTHQIKLVIAANACLLIVNRDKKYFPGFESILIYPSAFVGKQVRYDGLIEVHEDSTRSGESWHRGPIVLSLQDVMQGSMTAQDGHNVVLHEFAHKLDEENGVMDGLPILRNISDYKQWAEVLTREYDEFLVRVGKGKNKVIDEYGAVSAPEFFAVATESFFEKSKPMKQKLPELYQQLQMFYGLDPAQWRSE